MCANKLKKKNFCHCILQPSSGVLCLSGHEMIQPGKSFLNIYIKPHLKNSDR